MARTQIRGISQILDNTINYAKVESTSLVESTYDGGLGIYSASVSADNTVPSTLAVKNYVTSEINSLAAGLIYKGVFNANVPNDYSTLVPASQGDFYKISVAGTIYGVDWQIGDMLIINKDCSGSPLAADVDKVDNTESADIVRLTANQTLENKTIDGDLNTITDLALSSLKAVSGDAGLFLQRDANGVVISAAISASQIAAFDEYAQDAVGNILTDTASIVFNYNDSGNTISASVSAITSANVTDFNEAAQDAVGNILTNTGNVQFNYNDGTGIITASVSAGLVPVIANYINETLTDSGDKTIYTCSQVPVLVISITVDGLEQEEGYDYNINFATKTITFTSANHATDRVRIKYFKG